MVEDEDIGSFLKRQRERRRWSQQYVASLNSWDQAKVSKIETGRYRPSIDDMEAFAEMYGVSLVRLVKLRARAA